MPRYGETLRSLLPWDIPWFLPDHAIFFGLVYAVLIVLGAGITFVVLKSVWETCKECGENSEKSGWDASEDPGKKH